MRFITRLIVASTLLAMFSQHTSASAADVIKFKGLSASAFFNSYDETGCIVTGGSVFVTEQVLHTPPGPGTPSPLVLIDLFQYDVCNDQSLLSASGDAPLAKSDFQVDGNLEFASLNTTVTMYDFVSQSFFDVTVDMNWIATSPRGHENTHTNLTFQGCHRNLHTNSAFRFAQASGTVSDGTMNFTPLPSIDGYILSAKTGDISHGCN